MASFTKVYEEYGKQVYKFLLSLTGDPHQAEELLQETFYQAFLHIDQFEGRSSLYTWLCRIGKNAWLKECARKNRFTDQPLEKLTIPDRGTPESDYLEQEEYRWIRRAVLNLEEPYKDVFILHVYGGLKLKESGASYGKSESWARVTYYRARQKIIQEVSE